jgi:protein involved in polysaccharide export with SLBB domain
MRVSVIGRYMIVGLFMVGGLQAQIPDKKKEMVEKQAQIPRAFDFRKYWETEESKREDFEEWKRQQEIRYEERLNRVAALERSVDPQTYLVGPEDIFLFTVWELDVQHIVKVSPEGKILLPSIGELDIKGKVLNQVQQMVEDSVSRHFPNSHVTLSLEALRYFRIHVVGEVKYPNTYVAQAVDRISEMIMRAGGLTDWAWKGGIELRRHGEPLHTFNLNDFEQKGDLSRDRFVNGGDVIYVPPLKPGQDWVTVEGDLENSGTHQIFPEEDLMAFLERIRALRRKTNLSQIIVIRQKNEDSRGRQEEAYYSPFQRSDSLQIKFLLQGDDRIILPSQWVFVKGNVQNPGAFPYGYNLRAKDYAGMAGGNFRSGSIKRVKVYHVRTGKTEKGPDVLVEPGDVVHLSSTLGFELEYYIRIIPTITSLILAAKAAGLFGD